MDLSFPKIKSVFQAIPPYFPLLPAAAPGLATGPAIEEKRETAHVNAMDLV